MSDTKITEVIPAPRTRRGVLGLLGSGGLALVGGLAGVLATAQPAAADCLGSPCCSLASCTRCAGQCWNYSCPPNYNKHYWGCVAGARPIWCGECAAGGDCWSGPFACSIWWDDNAC